MADSIATRVSRIISGSAHALLDKAENLAPEAVMAQSIREIEQVVSEVRADLGKAEAAKHLVLTQIAKLNTEHEQLDERVEVAVAQNRDDLASAAIGRQSDIEDLLPVLQKSLDEQTERGKELESFIIALNAKKRELDQTLTDYQATLASQSATASPSPSGGGSDRKARVEEAESSFGRVMARQTGAAGIVSGISSDAGKLKELADMQRSNRIAERLAALKATRGL